MAMMTARHMLSAPMQHMWQEDRLANLPGSAEVCPALTCAADLICPDLTVALSNIDLNAANLQGVHQHTVFAHNNKPGGMKGVCMHAGGWQGNPLFAILSIVIGPAWSPTDGPTLHLYLQNKTLHWYLQKTLVNAKKRWSTQKPLVQGFGSQYSSNNLPNIWSNLAQSVLQTSLAPANRGQTKHTCDHQQTR